TDLFGDAFGDGAGRQTAGLGVPDGAHDTTSQIHADLRQLGGLAGTGLTGDDHDLVVADGFGDVVPPGADRQFFGVTQFGDGFLAQLHPQCGLVDVLADLFQHRVLAALVTDLLQSVEASAQAVSVCGHEVAQPGAERADAL